MPSMTTPSRGTVPRASEKLKFDQFFSAPDTAPIVERASAAQPEVDPASVEHPSAQPGDEPPKDDDDLDQFHGWLKGLTQ